MYLPFSNLQVIATIPFIPGHEAVGTVVARGAGCTVDIGTRYSTLLGAGWTVDIGTRYSTLLGAMVVLYILVRGRVHY